MKKTPFKKIAISLVYCSLYLLGCSSLKHSVSFKPNWEEYLHAQDPVWDTLNAYFYDGPMTGNGLIGSVLHRMDKNRFDGDTNKFLFEINRADLTDSCLQRRPEGYYWSRMQVGRFEFKPSGIVQNSKWRIDLWNAEIRGNIITDKGTIAIRHYTHAVLPVMVTEIETKGDESADDFHFVPDLSGCLLNLGALDFQEKGKYDENPLAVQQNVNEIFLHRQVLKNSNRYFVVEYTSKKEEGKKIYYSTIEYSNPVKAASFKAENILLQCRNEKADNLLASHREWWHKFYPKSFLSIPDVRMNNYYWIQRYVTGSAMRENLQMMDLMGPWYAHTVWQGIWWNLNTQLMYAHLLSSNNLEAAHPLGNAIDEQREALINNVPLKYRPMSAGIGRGSSYDMRSNVNPDDSIPPFYNRETGNLTWAMHNYYLYYRYSMNDSLLKKSIYPLLKLSINLYINLAIKDKDGKYHLPVTMSPEYKPAADCNYDLALFKWGLETLISSSARLQLKDESVHQWKEILNNIVEYPKNETGFMIGKDVALETAHRHFSHLLMIYPLGIYSTDRGGSELTIRQSIKHWQTLPGKDKSAWSYTWAAGAFAYLKDGNEALKNLTSYFQYEKRKHYYDLPGIGDNTMYREVGMCAETPFSFVKSVNDMMLQSHGNIIKIFPAMPDEWKDASFINFRTEGAFLISASRKNRTTQFFSVESLAGEPCVLQSPIAVESLIMSSPARIKKISAFTFSIDIIKGEKVIFYKKGIRDFSVFTGVSRDSQMNYWGTKTNP